MVFYQLAMGTLLFGIVTYTKAKKQVGEEPTRQLLFLKVNTVQFSRPRLLDECGQIIWHFPVVVNEIVSMMWRISCSCTE